MKTKKKSPHSFSSAIKENLPLSNPGTCDGEMRLLKQNHFRMNLTDYLLQCVAVEVVY